MDNIIRVIRNNVTRYTNSLNDVHQSKSQLCSYLVSFMVSLMFISQILIINTEAISTIKCASQADFTNEGCTFNNTTFNNEVILNKNGDWFTQSNFSLPDSRFGSALAVYLDRIILFGGRDRNNVFDETWIYNATTAVWTNMQPNTSPPARFYSGFANLWNQDKFVLFGGQFGPATMMYNNNLYCDTWIYDISDNNWTCENMQDYPCNRTCTLYSIYGTPNVILFGGSGLYVINTSGGGGYDLILFSDSWVFNQSDHKWTQIYITGNSKAGAGSASIVGDDRILAYGSSTNENITSVYDYSENKWIDKSPSTTPPKCQGPLMTSLGQNKEVLLFGGEQQNGPSFCETWLYDEQADEWYQRSPYHHPPVIDYSSFYGMFPISVSRVILFSSAWADAWIYDRFAYCSFGQYTSQYFEVKWPSEFISLNWSASVPPGTSLMFQLRSASNITQLEEKSFIGPDGTERTYYDFSGSSINAAHYGDRIIQYKAYFYTTLYNATPSLKSVEIQYDRFPGPPIPVRPGNMTWINNSSPTFEWQFNDSDSASMRAFEFQMNGTLANSEPLQYSSGEISSTVCSFTRESRIDEGKWQWRVRTMDTEGNWGEFSNYLDYGVDVTPPNPFTTIATPNRWTNGPCSVSFSTSDNLSGMANFTVFLDHHPIGLIDSPYNLSDLSDGVHRVTVRAYDIAGNFKDSEVSVFLDKTPPEPFTPVVDPSSWTYAIPLISYSTTDTTSGIDHYDLRVDNSSFSRQESPCSLDNLSDGVHSVVVRAFDAAGNFQEGSVIVYVDRTAPISLMLGVDPTGWTSSIPVVTFSATDQFSGIDHYEMSINNKSFYACENPVALLNLPDGLNNITVRAYDNIGNFAEGRIQVFIDTRPPENFTPVAEPGTWTYMMPSISFSTTDNTSGIDHFEMSIDGGSFQTKDSPAIIESMPDGTHFITVRAFDAAGNHRDGNVTAYIDRTPPIGVAMKIQGGEDSIHRLNVVLLICATDLTSGLFEMCFSNDGTTYTSWESFSYEKAWNLSEGEGEKTIFVRVRDRAGNEAKPSIIAVKYVTETGDPTLFLKLIAVLMIIGTLTLILWRVRYGTKQALIIKTPKKKNNNR